MAENQLDDCNWDGLNWALNESALRWFRAQIADDELILQLLPQVAVVMGITDDNDSWPEVVGDE